MVREAAAWAAGGQIAVDKSVVGIWLWLQRSNDDVVGAEPLRFLVYKNDQEARRFGGAFARRSCTDIHIKDTDYFGYSRQRVLII